MRWTKDPRTLYGVLKYMNTYTTYSVHISHWPSIMYTVQCTLDFHDPDPMTNKKFNWTLVFGVMIKRMMRRRRRERTGHIDGLVMWLFVTRPHVNKPWDYDDLRSRVIFPSPVCCLNRARVLSNHCHEYIYMVCMHEHCTPYIIYIYMMDVLTLAYHRN